jgi:hypothetical protein
MSRDRRRRRYDFSPVHGLRGPAQMALIEANS